MKYCILVILALTSIMVLAGNDIVNINSWLEKKAKSAKTEKDARYYRGLKNIDKKDQFFLRYGEVHGTKSPLSEWVLDMLDENKLSVIGEGNGALYTRKD